MRRLLGGGRNGVPTRSRGRAGWPGLVGALGLVGLVWLLAPAAAFAHAYLERATPAAGSSLPQAPSELRLVFTEPLDPGFSRVQVLNARRDQVDRGDSHVAPDDPRTLVVSLDSLPDGLYTVAWRTLSSVDGHTVNGAYPLIVGTAPASDLAATAQASAETSFSPETAVARWWLYLSASLVFGGLLTWRWVLSPLLGGANPGLRHTVQRRARLLVVIGGVLLVVGTLYAALAQASSAGDVPLWNAFGAPLQGVLARGRYAAIWWPRLGLALAVLALVSWRGVDGTVGDVALAATPAILLTSSLTSHAAALLSGPYLAIAVDWLHFLAVSAWIGGLAALVFVLPTAVRADTASGQRILARCVARFSTLALVAVLLIAASGTFQAWLEIGSWEGLFETAYGHSVLTKVGLMAIMVALGAYNLLVARPRLAALASGGGATLSNLARVFRRAIRLELGLGVVVLAVAALLTGLAPGREEVARRASGEATTGPVDRQIESQGLNVRVRITPASVGQNELAVSVPGVDPSSVERVQLTLSYLDAELGSQPVVLQPAGGDPPGWQTTTPLLSQPGRWQADLLIRRTGQDDARGTVRFGVSGAGGASASGSTATAGYPLLPSPITSVAYVLMGAGAVVAVVGLMRRDRRARATRAAVVAAGLLVMASGGYVYAREQREGVTLDVTNIRDPVPADDRSLASGKEIYETYCAACHGETGRGDGPAGLRLVPRPADLQVHLAPGVHPDGQLFYWLSYGVSGTAMPAWHDTLTEEQRWDVINYARTLVPQR